MYIKTKNGRECEISGWFLFWTGMVVEGIIASATKYKKAKNKNKIDKITIYSITPEVPEETDPE